MNYDFEILNKLRHIEDLLRKILEQLEYLANK